MSLVGASRCENLSIKPNLSKNWARLKEDQVRDADLALAVRAAKPMSALADLRGFAPNRRAAPDFAPNLERLKSSETPPGRWG